jgi:long-chain acyl-CoA synthetase
MDLKRTFDILPYAQSKYPSKEDFLAGKQNGKWIKYSLEQYREIVDHLSYALIAKGIRKGDKIATVSINRPEWNFVDMAVAQIGAVHVPIYPSISVKDYEYILNHAEIKMVFIQNKELYSKVSEVIHKAEYVEAVYSFDEIENIPQWKELAEEGSNNSKPEELQNRKDAITEEDLATMIYTSGTTGNPKGVMLLHRNIMSNVEGIYIYFPVDHTHKALSYLPLSHVFERAVNYAYQRIGVSIYYAEHIGKIADNLKEISPSSFTTVPRLLEKIFDKIMAKGSKLQGIQKKIFDWAIGLGLEYDIEGKSLGYKWQLALARKLVFSKWQEALGGNMRVIISGGAALQERLARIFTAAGMPVLEGYGLTETSPVITVNNLDEGNRKFGTVGPTIKGVEIKIAEDKEILTRGPSVMKGYYKAEDLTKEAIDEDGWFHTGDLGAIIDNKFLKIVGRKKAMFKTAMGKYVNPEHIESSLVESPFIDAVVVLGDSQKFAGALIVPDFEHLKSWARTQGIKFTGNTDLVSKPEVFKEYRKIVDAVNKSIADYERIAKFHILDHTWTIDSGDLTPSLKVKRNHISTKYKDVIDPLFK